MRGNITRRARLAVLEYQRTRGGRDSSCRGLEFRCPIKVCVFDGASSCRSSASVGSRPSRISRRAATAAIAILGKHFVWSTFQLDSDPLAWKTACAGQSEPAWLGIRRRLTHRQGQLRWQKYSSCSPCRLSACPSLLSVLPAVMARIRSFCFSPSRRPSSQPGSISLAESWTEFIDATRSSSPLKRLSLGHFISPFL
jgi:hypothetical protein